MAPVAQYWYLYALFEMFLTVPIIEFMLCWFHKLWVLFLFVICALYIQVNISCIGYLISYTCFFYMGTYFNYSKIMRSNYVMRTAPRLLFGAGCVMSIVIYVLYRRIVAGGVVGPDTAGVLQTIARMLLVITVVVISFAITGMNNLLYRFLARLSQYSFYIYLFHTWFSGTLRVLLRKAGCENSWIQVICGFTTGLAGSIAVAVIIKKVPLFRFWFEPLKVVKRSGRKFHPNY